MSRTMLAPTPRATSSSVGYDGVELELAPHEGLVHLRRSPHSPSQWHLWHARTRECASLPATAEGDAYELTFDGSFGVLWRSLAEEPLLVDEVLSIGYYYDGLGRGVIMQKASWAGAPEAVHVLAEDTAAKKYVMAAVHARLGANHTPVKFMAAVRFLPTPLGTRLQWSLLSVLEVGGVLHEKGGCNSVWMHKRLERWGKRLAKVCFDEQLLLSKPDRKHNQGESSRGRFLPFVSMGTCGLLLLVASWASPAWGLGR